MRLLTVTFMILSIAVAATAGSKNGGSGSEPSCAGTGHSHQYSDIRIAAVEITGVDECGFSYVDLEQNTVGLDNYFTFDRGLEIIQVEKRAENAGEYQMIVASPKNIKPGMRAVAVYCLGCRAVLNLKQLKDSDIASRK
ncbi:MAG TPA: hypothetical protein VNO14_18260 [Blastocatellia bacterium]|nr:hypothetical protein [Blastocatellia bacterium]